MQDFILENALKNELMYIYKVNYAVTTLEPG